MVRKEKIKISGLIIGLMAAVFFHLYFQGKIRNLKSNITEKTKKFEKAFSLYQKIKDSSRSKHYFTENLLLFVQNLGEKEGIKEKILSVTPLPDEKGETVRVKIKGLTLKEMLNIFQRMHAYTNLEVKQFTLSKNFASPELLDLDITLRKTK